MDRIKRKYALVQFYFRGQKYLGEVNGESECGQYYVVHFCHGQIKPKIESGYNVVMHIDHLDVFDPEELKQKAVEVIKVAAPLTKKNSGIKKKRRRKIKHSAKCLNIALNDGFSTMNEWVLHIHTQKIKNLTKNEIRLYCNADSGNVLR